MCRNSLKKDLNFFFMFAQNLNQFMSTFIETLELFGQLLA